MMSNKPMIRKLLTFLLCIIPFISIAHADDELESLAIVERQIVNTHVNKDGSDIEVEELTKVIKSQIAIDSGSQVDIGYNSTFQEVEVLDAYTILPSGEKLSVSKNAIRTVEDDISGGAAEFSDQKHRIIIFPNVTVGSKVYYKVKTTTHTPLFPKNYDSTFTFLPGREVDYFEWNFSHDKGIDIQVDVKDIEGGRVADAANGDIRYQFKYKLSKIKIKEPYQVSPVDFAPHLIFSSFKSHVELGRLYEERAKSKMLVTKDVQSLADEVTKGISDPKEQAKLLYKWVSKNIRYVAIYLGAGGVVPNDVDSIIRNRYGDCKDHDALLRALLAAKGIESSSALINAGDAFIYHPLGTVSPNNHVITYIPKWDIYLDSTQEMAPYGELSQSELDKPTVLTALGRIGRTPKITALNNQIITVANFKVGVDGRISGKSDTIYKGPSELTARYEYSGYVPVTEKKIVKDYLSSFRQTGAGKFIPSDSYDLDKPFKVASTFNLDPMINIPGPGAMTIPIGLTPGKLVNIAFTKPHENRHFPYVCISQTIAEFFEIEFPKNIKITKLPASKSIDVDKDSYLSNYSKHGNYVKVERILVLNRPGMVCTPGAVAKWKKIHQVIQKDLLGQIVYE